MTATASLGGVLAQLQPGPRLAFSFPFSDSFTRSNGAPGAPWFSPDCDATALQIISDQLGAPSATFHREALWLPQDTFDASFTAIYEASNTSQDLQMGFNMGACGREPYYLVATKGNTGDIGLLQTTDGVNFTSLTSVAAGITPGSTHSIRVIARATTCEVLVDGASIFSQPITLVAGRRVCDLRLNFTTGARFDDVSITAPGTAPTFVQRLGHNSVNGTSGSTLTLTLAAGATTGDTVLLGIRNSGGVAVSSVSDSRGNTWTVDKSSALTGSVAHLARTPMNAATLVAGDTITITWSSAVTYRAAAAMEYSGIVASPVDVSASGSSSGTNVTSLSTASTGTSAHANAIAVTVIGISAGNAGMGPPTSYTERDTGEKNASTFNCVDMADRLRSSTGTEAPAWFWTTGGTAGAVVVVYDGT